MHDNDFLTNDDYNKIHMKPVAQEKVSTKKERNKDDDFVLWCKVVANCDWFYCKYDIIKKIGVDKMALDKPKYGWEGISNGGEIYGTQTN